MKHTSTPLEKAVEALQKCFGITQWDYIVHGRVAATKEEITAVLKPFFEEAYDQGCDACEGGGG